MRQARVHHDGVPGLQLDRLDITAVQRPHGEAPIRRTVGSQRDSHNARVSASVRPNWLMVDVALKRRLRADIRELKHDLRVAKLARAQTRGKMPDERDDLFIPTKMRKPVSPPKPLADCLRRSAALHEIQVKMPQRPVHSLQGDGPPQDFEPAGTGHGAVIPAGQIFYAGSARLVRLIGPLSCRDVV